MIQLHYLLARIFPKWQLTVILGLFFAVAQAGQAQTETVLYSFGGPSGDGFDPNGVILGKKGILYGTTYQGGTYGQGTVFKVAPSGVETVLYSFGGQPGDGTSPTAGVTLDKAGNLYGTTWSGGSCDGGTVFKLTPGGVETVLYSFGCVYGDGYNPYAGVILDKAGNLYGTTNSSYGTVFKVTPAGSETVLYNFADHPGVGYWPDGGVVLDSAGNLYGTTSVDSIYGCGTVFRLAPAGTLTVLHTFDGDLGDGDGCNPMAGVLRGKNGVFYGTTLYGGAYGIGKPPGGTVYKVTRKGAETLLYSFGGQSGDGTLLESGLVLDKTGNLYGTTWRGGTYGYGTVYRLTPTGAETVLYTFSGQLDGGNPLAGVILDKSGNLFGTTQKGGTYGGGTVYKVTP